MIISLTPCLDIRLSAPFLWTLPVCITKAVGLVLAIFSWTSITAIQSFLAVRTGCWRMPMPGQSLQRAGCSSNNMHRRTGTFTSASSLHSGKSQIFSNGHSHGLLACSAHGRHGSWTRLGSLSRRRTYLCSEHRWSACLLRRQRARTVCGASRFGASSGILSR